MIQTQNLKLQDAINQLKGLHKIDQSIKDTDFKQDNAKEVLNILSNAETISLLQKIHKITKTDKITYEELEAIESITGKVSEAITGIKAQVDEDNFLADGQTLDIEKVEERFNKKKLRKKFPNIKLDRLAELYRNPPSFIEPKYESKEKIVIDPFVFRKLVLGIIQMVLDHMDLVWAITGGEGVGKSTHASQLIGQTYYILKETGIVDYDLHIKECFFNTLEKLRVKEDDFFDKPFRIFALDEGNELHRQNWKDEEVQTFFQRLRRERFNQRIKFICIPVLGEMMSQIVLSRVNFITEMETKNELRTGGLRKGLCNFYIIPRGKAVYSPKKKKAVSRADIKQLLHENMKDKNYLKGLPPDILLKVYQTNGTWYFKEDEYIKELKDTNKTFSVAGGFKLSDWEAFCFYKLRINLKLQGINSKDVIYGSVANSLSRLRKLFEENPDKMTRYKEIYERKLEEKELKDQNK